MGFLARTLLLALFALPMLAIVAIWLCLQDAPSIVRGVELTPREIENAKRIVDLHDPRKGGPGGERALEIGEQELDLVLNYAADRFGSGAARVALLPGAARLRASVRIPRNPFGRYLNLDATLRETEALPRFDRLTLGSLPVPAFVADALLREGLRWAATTARGELVADVVKDVRIAERKLTLTYVWSGEVAERARAVFVSAPDQVRLRAYHDWLIETLAAAPGRVSLAALMNPLFGAVLERSAGGDVVAENRAAIVVLATYVGGTGLGAIVPGASGWPRPARRTVTLAGRDDLAKHFMISAAIAALAGSALADAVGLHKEVQDSRGGSGFSFNDIGADRAGTRFGEIAGLSPERARKLAQALAAGASESDFMPEVADLPEFMPEQEFERRFGGIGGAGYKAMMATIEARVASMPLLR